VVIFVQNLLQTHPVFPHPSDCQFYFTCFFGKVSLEKKESFVIVFL
jgi:hypothetical protein